jgi:hypothetical protein
VLMLRSNSKTPLQAPTGVEEGGQPAAANENNLNVILNYNSPHGQIWLQIPVAVALVHT